MALERSTSVRMFVLEKLKLHTLDQTTTCLSGAHCVTETILHEKSVCICK